MTTETNRLFTQAGQIVVKPPARVASTANLTLSGEQTIDGVAVVADDRVLVKDQTDGSENGIYVASASTWARAADFNGSRDVAKGVLVYITDGTASGGALFVLDTDNDITLGTTSLTFTEVAYSTAGLVTTGGTQTLTNKTLTTPVIDQVNVSAATLALNAATVTIPANLVHSGDGNNLIAFGTDTQDFQTGGSSRLDISDTGVRLGGANARVTTVLDEDDMSSDSATALSTQQALKAYVDDYTGHIFSQDASNSASLDFGSAYFDSTKWDVYVLDFGNLVPDTDNDEVWIRLSDDGSTYEADASDYKWGYDGQEAGAAFNVGSAGDTKIVLTRGGAGDGVGSGTGEDGISGTVRIYFPHLAKRTMVRFETLYIDSNGGIQTMQGGGYLDAAVAVSGVQLICSSGNIESGSATLSGRRAS